MLSLYFLPFHSLSLSQGSSFIQLVLKNGSFHVAEFETDSTK